MIANLTPYPAYRDSGVPWLGEIPAHWWAASVKRHFDIQLGKMLQNIPSGPSDLVVPYLKAQHVQWFSVRTNDLPMMWASPSEIEKFNVQPGDLLVCEGGEGGRCGLLKDISQPAIIQNALHRVRPKANCRNDYLQYVMSAVSTIGWFDAINNKATIAHFTRDKFSALGIPVPPLSEQTAIARFLDHVDRRIRRYIRAQRKLIALLEEQMAVRAAEAMRHPAHRSERLGAISVQQLRPVVRDSANQYTALGLYNRGRGLFHKAPKLGSDLGDSTFFWVEPGDLESIRKMPG